jgi:hypothetical protein
MLFGGIVVRLGRCGKVESVGHRNVNIWQGVAIMPPT